MSGKVCSSAIFKELLYRPSNPAPFFLNICAWVTRCHPSASRWLNPISLARSMKNLRLLLTSFQKPFGLFFDWGRRIGSASIRQCEKLREKGRHKGEAARGREWSVVVLVVPDGVSFCSFQLLTTSSHFISDRILYKVGSLGFFEARR